MAEGVGSAPPEGIARRCGERAREYAEEGWCCSEAMVLAVAELFAPEAGPSAVRLAAGLCGGMGNHQATCGVFTGGALALGLAAEALPQPGDRRTRGAAAHFQERLATEAGGSICAELLERMGESNQDRHLCRELTRRGAELLAEILLRGNDTD